MADSDTSRGQTKQRAGIKRRREGRKNGKQTATLTDAVSES